AASHRALDEAPERVAVLSGRLDGRDHGRRDGLVRAADRRPVYLLTGHALDVAPGADPADLRDPRDHLDVPAGLQELPRRRHPPLGPRAALARARAGPRPRQSRIPYFASYV